MVIPLKLGDRVLGLLDLGELCPESQSLFTGENKDNVELATAIAAQSTFLIGRMRSLDFAERGRKQLLSFYNVSSKLIAQKNPARLPLEIVKETRKAAGAVMVDLVLIDEQSRARTPISVPERPPNRQLQVRPDGVSMRVFRSGIAERFPDLSKERGRLNPELVENAKAAVCLPLSLPYRRIGVLWLRYDHLRHFAEQEIVALQLYVNQAAMAYENAQEEARLKRLGRAADALASETELNKVREQILASARKVLKTEAVIFGFFDDENNTFVRRFSDSSGIAPEIWEQYRALGMGKDTTASRLLEKLKTNSAAAFSLLGKDTTASRLLEKGFVFINDVNDTAENEILGATTKSLMRKTGVVSFQAMTLKVAQERLGLICALYPKPHSFDEKERLTAASFARYAALALKKAKLVEQVKKTNEAATAVAKVTVLGNRLATLEAIVGEVRAVIGCDVVVLFEYDRDKQRLMSPTATGVWHSEKDFGPEEEYGLVYEVLNEKKLLKVEHVSADTDFKDRSFAKNEQIESFVAFPLYATGEKVGVIFISYRTPRHFTAEELETIELFANQSALAIHYAQSTEADARKLRELEALERLSDQLRQAQSLQEMMECTVVLAAAALGAECCNIVLPDQSNKLCLRAQFGWYPRLPITYFDKDTGSQSGFTILKKQPTVVDDYSTETRFTVVDHLLERGIKSGLSVPMFRDGQVVGALLVFTTKSRRFTDEEVKFLGLIANHVAMALRSMERYENLQRKDKHLLAVYVASQAILNGVGQEQQVLDRIMEGAVASVSSVTQPKVVIGTMQLYDAERNRLVLRSIYPAESFPQLMWRVGKSWSLDKARALEGRIGVTGRTIREERPQLVGDLSQDPDYINYTDSSKSELSVPLWWEGKPIGTINVESDQFYGFDADDEKVLEALASHAVIAIQSARLYEALKVTKGLVGTRTALAWMGMANNAWRHIIAGDAAEIANRVTLLRDFLKQGEVSDERIHRHLAQIERLAKNIHEKPVTTPLSSEEGVSLVNLNDLVTERLGQLRQNERYDGVRLMTGALGQPPLRVRVSSEWLRRALDILVDNATRAVRSLTSPDLARCVVTVSTALNGQTVELRVTDRGTGIPDHVLANLFKGKIESPNGFGVGLLIAQAVVEAYGGEIKVGKTDAQGTEMLIRLPHHS